MPSQPAFPLAIEQSGSSAPLILVHGMAGDRHTWDRVSPVLAQQRQVIRYDLRGFGQSPGSIDTPYSHGDDLLALMDHLGLARCDLLGASMGGSIALHFALDHPARVRRLILESPSIKGWDWSDAWLERTSEVEHVAREAGVDAARALWLRHPLFAQTRRHPDAFAALRAEVARYSGRHWLSSDQHAPLLRPDVERLDQLAAPTLLITGALDMPDICLIAETLVAMAPDIVRVDVEDAGHAVHLERPQAFIDAVEGFLR